MITFLDTRDIDKTLSLEGKVAGAKETGDALAKKIPIPQTAKVGQIIAVKAVDKNGVPTEFEVIDKPSGNVKTVNGNSPDENGNIDLGSLEADWNTLKNRPFYTEEGEEVDVFPETEVTMSIADAGDDGTGLYALEYINSENALFSLVEGETYLLAINGELYEATAVALENGIVYIGNTLFLGSSVDNGLPFTVASGVLEDGEVPEYVNVGFYLTKSTEAEITIPIRIYQCGEAVHPLDEKYLPKEAIEAMIDAYMEDALGGEY